MMSLLLFNVCIDDKVGEVSAREGLELLRANDGRYEIN